jgi:ATP-dependent helicase Lhr and Lhr-like helicase
MESHLGDVHPGGTVIARGAFGVSWWTWAGYRANATLAATLSGLADGIQRFDDARIRLRSDLTVEMWKASTNGRSGRGSGRAAHVLTEPVHFWHSQHRC